MGNLQIGYGNLAIWPLPQRGSGAGASPSLDGGLRRITVGWLEDLRLQTQSIRPELSHDCQRQQAILCAPREVDTGRFVEVPDRDRDVTQLEPEVNTLGQELGIEYEIV